MRAVPTALVHVLPPSASSAELVSLHGIEWLCHRFVLVFKQNSPSI